MVHASMQVDVLEYYETSVRSASAQFLIPAVLRVRMYVSKRELKSGRLSLSRRNILLRDNGQCQCVPHDPLLQLLSQALMLDSTLPRAVLAPASGPSLRFLLQCCNSCPDLIGCLSLSCTWHADHCFAGWPSAREGSCL